MLAASENREKLAFGGGLARGKPEDPKDNLPRRLCNQILISRTGSIRGVGESSRGRRVLLGRALSKGGEMTVAWRNDEKDGGRSLGTDSKGNRIHLSTVLVTGASVPIYIPISLLSFG